MGAIHIGTSGWHYRHWLGPFYPPGLRASKMLEFYLQHFDTVELNNSFYRLPLETALANWRESTPPHFCFAMKGSRFITHMIKLRNPEPALERFFARADLLGEKLGPIVFQLPPQWPLNFERLETFLAALPPGHRYSFEFRNETWQTGAVYDLLRCHNAAFCIFDLAGFQSPLEITADFTYIRLHGPGGKYQGTYSGEALTAWAERLRRWNLPASYVYFDNDQAGYAAADALRLRALTAR